MYRYFYNYSSETQFSQPVFRHSFMLRSIPYEGGSQRVIQSSLEMSDNYVPQQSKDSFGAKLQYGILNGYHTRFSYKSSGVVEVERYYGMPHTGDDGMFASQSKLTIPTLEMRVMASDLLSGLTGTPLDKALRLCDFVNSYMEYQPNSTQNSTSAGQAFGQRKGVCQDFAHILVSMCRSCGIPARYVNGLVKGEGKTHAWTEILSQEIWFGVDPTANRLIARDYIKIAHGRDASDCPVNRGIFCGTASQQTQTNTFVVEL